jgi:hypothetical protein
MSSAAERIKALQKCTAEFAKAEKQRIQEEVDSLTAIQKGRLGGNALNTLAIEAVAAAAGNSLRELLAEEGQ